MMLRDKVVLVSGVGPGLGRSLAVRCAENGADVVLAARTESTLDSVAEQVRATGRRALSVPTDIADQSATEHLAEAALSEFGRLDCLINSAFGFPPMGAFDEVDIEGLRAAIDVTLFATLRLTRLCVPALVESGGNIVMINSMIVRRQEDKLGGYRLTKSALMSLSQTLATELGPRGVRVNSVAPGRIWDERAKWYFGYLGEQRGLSAEDIYKEYAELADLRRLPEPDAVANAAVFLASELANAITGQCLDVNCGEMHH
ncbi:SDR family oxidoreductase [Sciscionella marina]|uniref:SDR family oxidoreductase n=1 Tax=Sciscionella marina TaxID=508770 RepID=UPI00036F8B12|nr:SDR family oxidoreductase [Sciscionella marina]